LSDAGRTRRKWERDEIVLAFELYCTLPSSSYTIRNPQVIALSEATGHSAGSVKAMLENFKSFDPDYVKNGKTGLGHGSRMTGEVVSEFIGNWDDLVWETDNIKRAYRIKPLPEIIEGEMIIPEGHCVERIAKVRYGQTFFRNALLANYEGKCCITGLAMPKLLRASHIKPWRDSNDINEKTNPQNGLLLNTFFDSAFDKGYITIDLDRRVVLSSEIRRYADERTRQYFETYEGKRITLPTRFLPGKQFIEYHNTSVFVE